MIYKHLQFNPALSELEKLLANKEKEGWKLDRIIPHHMFESIAVLGKEDTIKTLSRPDWARRECVTCSTPFHGYKSAKYCTPKCRPAPKVKPKPKRERCLWCRRIARIDNKFCSERCQQRSDNMKVEARTCPQCGIDMRGYPAVTLYCTNTCAKAGHVALMATKTKPVRQIVEKRLGPTHYRTSDLTEKTDPSDWAKKMRAQTRLMTRPEASTIPTGAETDPLGLAGHFVLVPTTPGWTPSRKQDPGHGIQA